MGAATEAAAICLALLAAACSQQAARPDVGPTDAGPAEARAAGDLGAPTDGIAPADDGPPEAGPDARSFVNGLDELFHLAQPQLSAVFASQATLSLAGCNRVAYDQLHGSPYFFIGRALNNTDPSNGCSGSTWSLIRNQLDGSLLAAKGPLLDVRTPVPVAVPGAQLEITTAYDPSTALFGDRVWVAFECHGVGFSHWVATCAGPLSADGKAIEPESLSVVVWGSDPTQDPEHKHSASVPKLFVHKGQLYLYWTVVRARLDDSSWVDIHTRGAALEVHGGKLRVKGSAGPLAANAPASVEVWGLGADARSDSVADVFDVVSDGRTVYATAAVGGSGCLSPLGTSPGCYRLAIGRARDPLQPRAFNTDDPAYRVPDQALPANPHEYSRIYERTDGRLVLYGKFFAMPTVAGQVIHDGNKPELPTVPGLHAFELPWDGPVCPADKPLPHHAARDGACRPSCGAAGGTAALYSGCAGAGLTVAGEAYDAPFCCR